MRSERLTILVSPQEKRRIANLAKKRRVSVGELVRTALAAVTRPAPQPAAVELTAQQIESLERAAEDALAALRRADAALHRAQAETAKTRRYFAAGKRRPRESARALRSLLEAALAQAKGAAG